MAEPCYACGGEAQASDRLIELLQDSGAGLQCPRLPGEGVQEGG